MAVPRALVIGAGVGLGFAVYQLLQPEPTTIVTKPWRFVPVTVKSNTPVTSDTNKIVFELPGNKPLGGQVASSILVRTTGPNGSWTVRPYSPISPQDQLGEVTLVVKKYKGGKSSTNIHALKAGDQVKISGGGPLQKFNLCQNQFNHITLIAGGSGITPVFQVLQKIATDPQDKTQVDLFYSSRSEIILKSEIDRLAAAKPDQLRVHYLSGEQRIDRDFLSENLDKSTGKVFVCGPPAMYKALSGQPIGLFQGRFEGALKDLGFTKDQVYKF